MKKYRDVILQANEEIKKYQKEETATYLLLMHFSKLDSPRLYASLSEVVPEDVYCSFNKALNQYLIENIPVQYLIGYETFYGYQFHVNEHVLIPRNETEELVERILENYDEYFFNQQISVLDLGCGSGCIGITLAKEEKQMHVSLTDISEEAIKVTILNAKSLEAKVTTYIGDLFNPIKHLKFDLIVSNPPYIPLNEDVCSLVKDNEPHLALFGGEDGLDFYRQILKEANRYLNEKAMIAFEHAYDKAKEIKNLALEFFPKANIKQYKDLANKDRITIILIGVD